jgi:hypothetical protein
MAKLRFGQKADRVLKFLLGMRHPHVLEPLISRGFQETDLEEGWRLLRGLAPVTFHAAAPRKNDTRDLVERLDRWENTWFPIADATLRRHFPELHEQVFQRISRTAGPPVIIGVGVFLERVTALHSGDKQSQRAAKLLVQRGMTAQVLAEARALVEQLAGAAGPPIPAPKDPRERGRAAEVALWSWYLEWSQIARCVITDRRVLRQLGLLRAGRDVGVDDTDGVGDDTGDAGDDARGAGDVRSENETDAVAAPQSAPSPESSQSSARNAARPIAARASTAAVNPPERRPVTRPLRRSKGGNEGGNARKRSSRRKSRRKH